MNYRLVWPERMIQRLATFYMVAKIDGLAEEFTTAIESIEQDLIRSPHDQGESREGNDRIVVVHPVAVTYRIDEDARAVFVVGMGYLPPHRWN